MHKAGRVGVKSKPIISTGHRVGAGEPSIVNKLLFPCVTSDRQSHTDQTSTKSGRRVDSLLWGCGTFFIRSERGETLSIVTLSVQGGRDPSTTKGSDLIASKRSIHRHKIHRRGHSKILAPGPVRPSWYIATTLGSSLLVIPASGRPESTDDHFSIDPIQRLQTNGGRHYEELLQRTVGGRSTSPQVAP